MICAGTGIIARKRSGTDKKNQPFFGVEFAIMGRTVEASCTADQYNALPPEKSEVQFRVEESIAWDKTPRYELREIKPVPQRAAA